MHFCWISLPPSYMYLGLISLESDLQLVVMPLPGDLPMLLRFDNRASEHS